MTNRTKSLACCCAGMMAAGGTSAQMAYTEFAAAPFIKAGIVGLVGAIVALVMMLLLPPRKTA